MDLLDWGSVQKLLSEIRPIRIEGSDPNVPILCPMESVWAYETRNLLKESTEQWIIWIPVTLLIIKNDDHNSMGLLNGRLDWQWKGFFSSKSDDLESNTLNSGSLKRSVLKTSLFLLNHTWKRVREKSTLLLLGARSAASSHICFESSTSTSSDSTSGSSYPGPKEVASGSG